MYVNTEYFGKAFYALKAILQLFIYKALYD